ncbi:hypothetical protein ABE82_26320 (plasmid) [Paenibacillus peoriae]|uniref:hypothetical protein n=1 Tax=Paenibacillus peoriae TaxID=59893 RepID=UPI00071FA007|nr:hypothetical protein [Paenibacillus peoriae]ALS09933.1 hypothetical protein ABE82_26320 [Paenibacillus peoriae]
MESEELTISDMSGEKCLIFDQDGTKMLAQATLAIKQATSFTNMKLAATLETTQNSNPNYTLTLKQITSQLTTGVYQVKVTSEFSGQYFLLDIKDMEWELKNANLSTTVEYDMFKVNSITKSEYKKLSNTNYDFDWSRLNIPDGCSGSKQADAFEDMVNDMLLRMAPENYSRIGIGVDRARDSQFEINMTSWLPKINAPTKWILQCKYSVNQRNLGINEIYKEMIKVLMHKPDYYLLVTNRKLTNDFHDWIKSDLMSTTNYFIPFKAILIQREELESLLLEPEFLDLKNKYFG